LEFISQSLDATINEICEEIDAFIDARQEIIGRIPGMDNVNSVFYAENLCELIFQFFSANLHQHIDRITGKIYALINAIEPVEYFNNEEQPIVYIEEHIRSRRVDSIPHFGRADDIRCLLAQTFDRIDDEAKALEVRLGISNEVVKTLSTYKRLKYLCDRGRITEAEDLLPTLLPLTLVFLHDRNKIRSMTRFNHEIFDISPINLYTLAVQKVAHAMFTNDFVERGRNLLISHIENLQSVSARMQTYSFLATSLVKAGYVGDAQGYLDRIVSEELIETSQSQSFALIELLQLLIQNRLAEQLEHLEQLANTIKIEALRQDGLRMLAEYLLTLNNEVYAKRGLQILEDLLGVNHDNTDQYMKCVSYEIIGKAFHRSGYTIRAKECILFALQSIDAMEDGLMKADVARTVAESMFHISDDHFVDNMFALAIQQSQKAFPRWDRIPILAFIAESLFRTGRTDLMKHVVSAAVHELRLRYPQAHGAIGSELINSLLKIGEFDLSVSIASSLRDDPRNLSIYNSVLQKIILELCRAGRFSDAANLQMMLTHPIRAAQSLIDFAVHLNEVHDKSRALSVLDHAEDLVTQIDDGSEVKDQLLASMAVAEARIRSFDKLQKTISSIRSRDQQDIARSRIADFLMAKHEYLHALALLNEDNLDDLIRHFVMWQHEFEKGHAGESIGLLAEMIRIASWYREDWNVIHEILRRMQSVVR
jgi:tetratricopeptide (TPR) repeat protein